MDFPENPPPFVPPVEPPPPPPPSSPEAICSLGVVTRPWVVTTAQVGGVCSLPLPSETVLELSFPFDSRCVDSYTISPNLCTSRQMQVCPLADDVLEYRHVTSDVVIGARTVRWRTASGGVCTAIYEVRAVRQP